MCTQISVCTHTVSVNVSLQRAEGDADALGGAVVHDRVAQVVPGHARQAVERAGGQVDRAHVGLLQGARRHLLASVGVPEQQPALATDAQADDQLGVPCSSGPWLKGVGKGHGLGVWVRGVAKGCG